MYDCLDQVVSIYRRFCLRVGRSAYGETVLRSDGLALTVMVDAAVRTNLY